MKSKLGPLLAVLCLLSSVLCAPADAQVVLSWQDNATNETGTTLERAPGLNATTGFSVLANIPSVGTVITGTDVRSYTDVTTAASTAYSYRVRAYNATDASGYSNVASITTRGPAPAAPSAIEATPPPEYTPPSATITLNAGESLTVVAAHTN